MSFVAGGEVAVGYYPVGKFDSRVLDSVHQLIMLAAGTGFTPMPKVLQKFLLLSNHRSKRTATLCLFNKTKNDIMWKDQMESLQAADDRFKVNHIFSREKGWDGINQGRVSTEVLTDLIEIRPEAKRLVAVCGPNTFVKTSER